MKPASGSMLEKPLLTSFSAIVRCMVFANGLSRQASRITSRSLPRRNRGDQLLERHRLRFGIAVGGELGVIGIR